MARLAALAMVADGNSTDEFPDIDVLVARAARDGKAKLSAPTVKVDGEAAAGGKKKRVLGRRDDNPLLRPWGSEVKQGKGRAKWEDVREVIPETQVEERGVEKLARTAGRKVTRGARGGDEVLALEPNGVEARKASRRRKMERTPEVEIPETQQEVQGSDSEAPVPLMASRLKNCAGRSKRVEKTPEIEIPETQRDVEVSDSEEPVPPTASRLKSRAVRSKRIEKTPDIEIPETQQEIGSISESDAPVPPTASRIKNRMVRPKRREISAELEIPETQQDVNSRRARPKARRVKEQDKNPIMEIQETQQEQNTSAKPSKSRRLVKRHITPQSESDDLADPITTLKPRSKTSTSSKRLETPELDEDELSISNKSSRSTGSRVPSKKHLSRAATESEDEDVFFSPLDEESDGMSDFVVDESEIEERQAPRSARRLVKGIKPQREEKQNRKDLEDLMKDLDVNGDTSDPFGAPMRDEKTNERNSKWMEAFKEHADEGKDDSKSKPSSQTSTDIDDHFTIKFTPPGKKARKVSKELRFTTPPGSPELKPKGLQSPKKIQRIPSTPHGPSVDDFWSQDVVNDWNDEYSPRKAPKPPPTSLFSKSNTISEEALFSPKKSPVKQNRMIKDAKKAFAERKHLLAETFLIELDTVITNSQVAKLAASTGGVKIIWSKKLNTTAGRANWKRETIRSSTIVGPDGKPLITYRHHAAIELAEKVIDDEDRLLNVIAHEFCHLANFMISNIKTNPHGKEFKAWASQVSRHFKHRGIEVTTKHSYTIDYKYIWECENCGLEFKRHSKSIDPARHRCGGCKAKLVQTKPVPRKGMVVSEYQLFLKENMKVVMKENPNSPQKEILGLVGKRYQEYKAGRAAAEKSESVVIREVDVTSKEGTPEEDGVDLVSRKLDFLDLSSP